ncbi:MAG: DNA-primase RepB domain-containing protein [Thermoanaerobaculaceae bacterium]|nr:DNA-primase RepB domain-containing protein [Thermoanaerobaculaceae bacterium]
MIAWWREVGIDCVDLAVRRPRLLPGDDAQVWLWHRAVSLGDLPHVLPWTRAENARRADIYARPARGSPWSVVFLDDLAQAHALELTTRHPGLCVHTSPEGGCQLWLSCEQPLDEQGRYRLQKHLAGLHGADPASVSGEHLGRLAGYRNWKRQGPWVNVLAATLRGSRLTALQSPEADYPQPPRPSPSRMHPSAGLDTSESGREWGWVMGALEAGREPDAIYHQLLTRARLRRGTDSERYARRTIERALHRLSELPPQTRRRP